MDFHLSGVIQRILKIKPWSDRSGAGGGSDLCDFLLLPILLSAEPARFPT